MRFGSKVLSIGTGLLYQRHSKNFIVTAWHNLTALNSETLEPISTTGAIPDNVLASVAIDYPDHISFRASVPIPLHHENNSRFLVHPRNWPRIDVAVIPVDFDGAEQEMHTYHGMHLCPLFSVLKIGEEKVLPEICPVQNYLLSQHTQAQQWLNQVDVSEELFIPGYPQNIMDRNMQPVWKRATIASSVRIGWNGERKFLVDSASQSGMSGAPVFLYSPNGKLHIGSSTCHVGIPAAVLAGVYVGRVGVTEKVDPQIGIVFHASVIDEIIDANHFAPLPHDLEHNNRALEAVILAQFKTMSPEGIANVKDKSMPSRYYVRSAVLNQIEGRASHKRVLEEILALAENYRGPYRDV